MGRIALMMSLLPAVSIAPKSSSEAGNNATLGKFAKEYATVQLTNTSVPVSYTHLTLPTNREV